MQHTTTFVAFALLLATIHAEATLLRKRQTPEEVQGDMEHRTEDSFGRSTLEPPCSKVECGEMSCPAPFELKMDDTCCGYCWAPDHAIPLDRHVGIAYNSTGMAVEQCESAPSHCKAPVAEIPVRCFKPSCRAGEAPHCGAGACCAMCEPDGSR